MPVVFVHGVPEAAAIWDPLLARLGWYDVVTLTPPGFGAPVPDGFSATADAYLAWLTGEVEALRGPVDLVGHDWGGGHVARLAAARPDLIRSWCLDIAGMLEPGYVWHDLARVWQTPERGEELVAAMFAPPLAERVAALQGLGMTADAAVACARAGGPEMARCILALYRSARQPAVEEWGRRLAAAERRPGLVINATADEYTGGPERAHHAAAALGAREAVLDGLGHWWMLEDPAAGAAALAGFLKNVDRQASAGL